MIYPQVYTYLGSILYLVDANNGPATVWTVLTPAGLGRILGLILMPHGEPSGLNCVIFSPRLSE